MLRFFLPFLLYGQAIEPISARINAFSNAIAKKAEANLILEKAEKEAILNKSLRITEHRKLLQKKETSLEKKERVLNNVEKGFALRQKEAELRKKGALPPKKETRMVFMGKIYSSYGEFKGSPEYIEFLLEVRKRVLQEQMLEEQKQKEIQEIIKSRYNPVRFAKEIREEIKKGLEINHKPFAEWPEEWKKAWRNQF